MNQAFINSVRRIAPRQWLAFGALTFFTMAALWLGWRWWKSRRPVAVLTHAVTLAGAGPQLTNGQLSDPFGVVADDDGNVFISDGLGGRIYKLDAKGQIAVLADNLDMPSGLALTAGGALVLANTGAHTILRIDVASGAKELIAGIPGQRGSADGAAARALFNAPVGVAVRADGAVLVADTYNDLIRVIGTDGQVRTLAGNGLQGWQDGAAVAAQFDTPCGLAVRADGTIFIADTGNHRIRALDQNGNVTTLAGTGEPDTRDGELAQAAFNWPLAVALRRDGALAVADGGASAIRLVTFGNAEKGQTAQVMTLAGGFPFGLGDGAISAARFNFVTGLAFDQNDTLLAADAGNGFMRALLPAGDSRGRLAQPAEALLPAQKLRAALAPRWPFEPPDKPREIAGTFGEIRGVSAPNENAWFHNGLDVPGAYGETVYAMHSERVTRPLAVEGVGETRERLRLPLFGYIHVRIGRDQNDVPLPGFEGVQLRRDADGKVIGVRVPRGTHIRLGQAVGTLNRLNHVHLIAGPLSSEINALAALPLPGIRDTLAPLIEQVALVAADDLSFNAATLKPEKAQAQTKTPAPEALPVVRGRQRIIVTAYDQADGNASYRRLGLYRLGYQVLKSDGSPVEGFAQPRFTLTFERLPQGPGAAALVYATGSQSGYTDRTIFAYQVTNELRDGAVTEGFWDTSVLMAGDYTVRVVAEDFFRNQAQKEIRVTVAR